MAYKQNVVIRYQIKRALESVERKNKKEKRSKRKFRIIRRKINRKSRINLKSEQCGKIIEEKTC